MPEFKVWINVELVDNDNDEYYDCGLPDCLKIFNNEQTAHEFVAYLVDMFNPDTAATSDHCKRGNITRCWQARSVSDLELSVRARKCMIRLGITTVGALLLRSPNELLECKNFGESSLQEIREKLALHNLRLRSDEWQPILSAAPLPSVFTQASPVPAAPSPTLAYGSTVTVISHFHQRGDL